MKPFDLIRPNGVASPVVVSVPHAGLHVPDELQGELDYDECLLMANADHAVDALYVGVTTTGASLLRANVSRIVVDLNRAPSDIDVTKCSPPLVSTGVTSWPAFFSSRTSSQLL